MDQSNNSKIGILCWEANLVTKSIQQLAKLKGNSTNLNSYKYPVILRRVKGACAQTIVIKPDENILNLMISEMRNLKKIGVKAITTSCGFNAIHQKKLANSIDIPVFTSSILQVPFVSTIIGLNQAVAIITARKKSLTPTHIKNAGIGLGIKYHIFGMEDCRQWSKILNLDEGEIDIKETEKEIVSTCLNALKKFPEIGAFVLECTEMPPFASSIKKATGLPVFDFITMTDYVYQTL